MAGMYIHIPFCKQACSYCNFHFSTSTKNREKLVDAICNEIAARQEYLQDKQLKTLYFGGGTPSMLSQFELESIFNSLSKHYDISELEEVCLEANPDDLSSEKLNELKQFPINRFSMGIQSFQQEDLDFMNRAHTAAEGTAAIKRAQDAGFENLNVDLIFGIPTSNLKKWEKNLQKFFGLNVPHLSSYALTLEEKTAYWSWVQKGKVKAPNEEELAAQYQLLQTYISNESWEHYELSNYCKEGYRAVHNTNYWTGKHYIGIGPSAHSYNGISRRWNLSNNVRYFATDPKSDEYFEKEILKEKDRYHELLINRLRTKMGIDLDEMKEDFSIAVLTHFQEAVKSIEDYLQLEKDAIRIKEQYWLTSDHILRKLMLD